MSSTLPDEWLSVLYPVTSVIPLAHIERAPNYPHRGMGLLRSRDASLQGVSSLSPGRLIRLAACGDGEEQ